jgi:hypothetical protein
MRTRWALIVNVAVVVGVIVSVTAAVEPAPVALLVDVTVEVVVDVVVDVVVAVVVDVVVGLPSETLVPGSRAARAGAPAGAVGPSAQAVASPVAARPIAAATRAMRRVRVGCWPMLRSVDMCVFAVLGGFIRGGRVGAVGPRPGIDTPAS